jgi:hypothetical protein
MPPSPHNARVHPSAQTILRLGLIAGAALSAVAIAWLLIANRVPALDRLAMLRNLTAGALVVVIMLVPVWRFRGCPAHVLTCGLTSWSVLTLVYAILQIPFPLLGIRMGTFHFFMLGAVLLGLASVLLWVVHLVSTLRHEPVVPARRRAH